MKVYFFCIAMVCAASQHVFAENITVWSSSSQTYRIAASDVIFSRTVDVDDPLSIVLHFAEKDMGTFPIKDSLRSIYKKAKATKPVGAFFGSVLEFLIQGEKNSWFFVWYETQLPSHPRLMIFPATQISEKPPLFSATSFGQESFDPSLIQILHPLAKKSPQK